jgi:pimeloyl-ACP methyl ester carboxylesterase
VAAAPPIAVAEEPAIDWIPCAGAEGVDCATIEVPLDWSEPDGQTIHIGLARRPAKDPANRIGSVLMDPGGPGGSGVDTVMNSDVFTEEVNARFDVVGFDPRGINTSTQLRCDDELGRQALDARHPTNQDEFDALASLNRQLHESCREHSGALVDHVDNLHTVRDMDAIREALGEEKLTYVGYSYGSLMGQQYAEEFPERIRALVLDGNMDHSLRTAWDFMRTETESVEKNFLEFAEWCDQTPDCALHGLDTKATYGALRERAKAGDLTDPSTGQPIDFYRFSQTAFHLRGLGARNSSGTRERS